MTQGDRLKSWIGALDSQNRDVPRYTKIISKFPANIKAGHSAYPGQNIKRCFRNSIECLTASIGHAVGFRQHRFMFEAPRDIPACELSAHSMFILHALNVSKSYVMNSLTTLSVTLVVCMHQGEDKRQAI